MELLRPICVLVTRSRFSRLSPIEHAQLAIAGERAFGTRNLDAIARACDSRVEACLHEQFLDVADQTRGWDAWWFGFSMPGEFRSVKPGRGTVFVRGTTTIVDVGIGDDGEVGALASDGAAQDLALAIRQYYGALVWSSSC